MASFKVVVMNNKQYRRKDGLYNVKIRLTHKRSVYYISTLYNILPKQINKDTGEIINHPNGSFFNIRLKGEILQYEKALMPIADRLDGLNAKEIINILSNSSGGKVDFFKYGESIAKELKDEGRAKSSECYYGAINKIKNYTTKDTLPFDQINLQFLHGFEKYMRKKEYSVTTIGIYLRSIRAIFNRAINEDFVEITLYPFRKYSIPKGNNPKRNLDIEELRKLRDIQLEGDEKAARDIFMLTFYLIGINFKDLYSLKGISRTNRIFYTRHKTSKFYSVRVFDEAKEIIDKYKGEKALLSFADKYKDHHSALKFINKHLRTIGTKCDLEFNLTTYFARHSWATTAVNSGISKDIVSLALGHSYGNSVTDAYLEYDMRVVDEANRKILDKLKA